MPKKAAQLFDGISCRSVKIKDVTVLSASEHTVCSDECANVLYFCAIYGYSVQDYVWLL